MAFAASVRHSGDRVSGRKTAPVGPSQPRSVGASRRPYPILVVPAWFGVFAQRWNGTRWTVQSTPRRCPLPSRIRDRPTRLSVQGRRFGSRETAVERDAARAVDAAVEVPSGDLGPSPNSRGTNGDGSERRTIWLSLLANCETEHSRRSGPAFVCARYFCDRRMELAPAAGGPSGGRPGRASAATVQRSHNQANAAALKRSPRCSSRRPGA